MELTAAKKKHFRTLGHKLKPIVMISDNGISEGVTKELNRALNDHELIKVKLNINDPDERKRLRGEICEAHNAQLVQAIGKIILIFRAAKRANPKLSNLHRPT